jgi:hypothetical protein
MPRDNEHSIPPGMPATLIRALREDYAESSRRDRCSWKDFATGYAALALRLKFEGHSLVDKIVDEGKLFGHIK